jgi:type IV pilus assembly protein PilB
MTPPSHPAPTLSSEENASSDSLGRKIVGLHPPSRKGRSAAPIGEVAVRLGFTDDATVEAAVVSAREQRKPTGQVLVENGALSSEQLARVLSERFGVDFVDLNVFNVDAGAVGLLDIGVARRYQAVPVGLLEDRTVLLAMADPSNLLTMDDVAMITGRKVRPAVASIDELRALIARAQRLDDTVEDMGQDEPEEEVLVEDPDADAPVIKLVHSLIAEAVEKGASDIHIDPEGGELRVIFRIDGVLYPAATVGKKMRTRVISRIKLQAGVDISEKRVSQDGRLAVNVNGRRVDLRVVTLPLVEGEGIVMRILDTGAVVRDLESLGMLPRELSRFRQAIRKRAGAILVTGPTGSGKSTSLYAGLNMLATGERSILTIEDPVETPMVGIKQMQVNAKTGLTFANGLRSMVRADPDVIMVGEIRDRETAHIAVQAALTGHLVLSTLHTRDAATALTRLIDMGIEPFMVASAVDCVVAQRLLRTLCEHCKRPIKLPLAVLREHGLEGTTPHEPVGCSRCGQTGYRGRIGIYEVMPVTEEIRNLVLGRNNVDEITAMAVSQGMRRLREDGLEKVKAGLTSIVEVGRVTSLL